MPLTEREWRKKQAGRSRTLAGCSGAQYLLPPSKSGGLKDDWAFRVFLLMLAAVIAVCLPVWAGPEAVETFENVQAQQTKPALQPRHVTDVSYVFPSPLSTVQQTYTREQLLRGKLLLLDECHPLPSDVPAPNTLSIAAYAKGSIPVRNLSIRSGAQTMDALVQLFSALHARGLRGLTVWQGTTSAAQQRETQEDSVRRLLTVMPPDEAVAATRLALDSPGTGELLQEYTVELRFQTDDPEKPDDRRWEETPQGQLLLQTAWRFGFVRSQPKADGREHFRFRYVGLAHATAITYLDLTLEQYLILLHEKQVITISSGGRPVYVILCQPMDGTHVAFQLPSNAQYEASLDNMGYAVVACTVAQE